MLLYPLNKIEDLYILIPRSIESFTSNKSFLSDCFLESLVDSGLSLETDLRAFVFRCLNGELDDLSPQSHQCLTMMEESTSLICLTLEDNKLYKTAFPTNKNNRQNYGMICIMSLIPHCVHPLRNCCFCRYFH